MDHMDHMDHRDLSNGYKQRNGYSDNYDNYDYDYDNYDYDYDNDYDYDYDNDYDNDYDYDNYESLMNGMKLTLLSLDPIMLCKLC